MYNSDQKQFIVSALELKEADEHYINSLNFSALAEDAPIQHQIRAKALMFVRQFLNAIIVHTLLRAITSIYLRLKAAISNQPFIILVRTNDETNELTPVEASKQQMLDHTLLNFSRVLHNYLNI